MDNLIKVGKVAAMAGVSVQTVYRYAANNEIPFYKHGRAVRFSPAEISKWLEGRKKGLPVELNEKPVEEKTAVSDSDIGNAETEINGGLSSGTEIAGV